MKNDGNEMRLFIEKFKSLNIVFADASYYKYSFVRDISYI